MDNIYLDYNATTPLCSAAREAMRPWLEGQFGNASSTHRLGQKARNAVEASREKIAKLLGCRPQEILFTSGGTESDNLAILGALRASSRGRHALASAVEHHAVLHTFHALPSLGFQAGLIPVDGQGRVELESLKKLVQPDTVLVSVMHANNETGVLQPIEAIGAWCRERKILFHCDAVQTVGKLEMDLSKLPVDFLSASAHKFGGPQGVGLLYVREGRRLVPLLHGGEQEFEIRPGTENVSGIVGMAAALEDACKCQAEEGRRLGLLRDRLQAQLVERIAGLKVNGAEAERVPNTLSACFPELESDILIMKLDSLGIQVSSGAACAAGAVKPSHVLMAMGLGEAEAQSAIRFSLGRGSGEEALQITLEKTVNAVQSLAAAKAS